MSIFDCPYNYIASPGPPGHARLGAAPGQAAGVRTECHSHVALHFLDYTLALIWREVQAVKERWLLLPCTLHGLWYVPRMDEAFDKQLSSDR